MLSGRPSGHVVERGCFYGVFLRNLARFGRGLICLSAYQTAEFIPRGWTCQCCRPNRASEGFRSCSRPHETRARCGRHAVQCSDLSLASRTRIKYVGTPLNNSQVHQMSFGFSWLRGANHALCNAELIWSTIARGSLTVRKSRSKCSPAS